MAATDKHNRPVGTKGGANQLSVRDLGEESRQEAIRWSGGGVDLNIRARETEEKSTKDTRSCWTSYFFYCKVRILTGPINAH